MIRAYKHSDFVSIANVYNLSKKDEFIGEDFDVTVTPLSEDQSMLDFFHASSIFVYEKNGIVGFIGVKENYISWLFVHPDCRGQGVARKLVLHALSALSGEVKLNVAKSNIPAISLYESLGFTMVEAFTGKYQCNSIAVLRMSKRV